MFDELLQIKRVFFDNLFWRSPTAFDGIQFMGNPQSFVLLSNSGLIDPISFRAIASSFSTSFAVAISSPFL